MHDQPHNNQNDALQGQSDNIIAFPQHARGRILSDSARSFYYRNQNAFIKQFWYNSDDELPTPPEVA